ncbi:probable E3 ubiquitin-protein ligase HIP1 [Dioscorea cayenensis subsp. rotundata]|uniref:RING-type E3 ubiquitin transferase n=1 Tax=Dioscorea cayennensis subsp. rotundata TaxID=55577 RepID=A0AB40BTM9_DIOCR|nr:probable E3 ubiquitin-protein ligase HIP1 [Dioscorea cayenensis subsp. rotundata]
MQGQRASVESFLEAIEFDHGASSSNTAMDQQSYWNNMPNPVEAPNMPEYILPPSVANSSSRNLASQGPTNLSIWHSGEPSSSGHSLNHGSHDGAKAEHVWPSSLTINAVGGPRVDTRQFEAASTLSLERVNITLNNNHMVEAQLFPENLNHRNPPQSLAQNAGCVHIFGPAPESEAHTYPDNRSMSPLAPFPSSSGSSNPCGSSSGCAGFALEEGDGRSGVSLDGRRLSCKRKNIEGIPGQSSASGNASCFPQNENSSVHHVSSSSHSGAISISNISSSSVDIANINSSEEQLTERFGTLTRGTASESYPTLTVAGNAESSQRNFRLRINPTRQPDTSPPNIWAPNNTSRISNVWSYHQSSSQPPPFNHSLDSRPVFGGSSSQIQHRAPAFPPLPPNPPAAPWSGTSSLRAGNFPKFREFNDNMRHMPQDPTHWSLANTSSSMPGNAVPTARGGSDSEALTPTAPTWVPNRNSPAQQRLSEVALMLLGNLLVIQSPHKKLVIILGLVFVLIGYHCCGQQFKWIDKMMVFWVFPLSMQSLAAMREGRNRMMSEIRNALDLMRRGENLRFDDVFLLDHPAFFGGADLHDRHRDMRLDVDNMSYEELLALEERIGNVSTGLGEEKIMKHLKTRLYLPVTLESPSEVEPCCICQEEYVDGEDLGTLDCGHDFHTGCIKQWLMCKNLCPICKTNGLVT